MLRFEGMPVIIDDTIALTHKDERGEVEEVLGIKLRVGSAMVFLMHPIRARELEEAADVR